VKWEQHTPRSLTDPLLARAADGPVALVFGREDDGLPNEALDRAHAYVTIPTTEHASLNLAQAIVVTLYELHLAAGDATRERASARKVAPPASADQMERLFKDQERALESVEFFKTRFRTHIMRSVRSLGFRMDPDAREIMMARAMWIEVVRAMNRYRGMAGLAPVTFDEAEAARVQAEADASQ
jgi:TrmH family RNA methyltransferase